VKNKETQLRNQRKHYHGTKNVRWKFYLARLDQMLWEELVDAAKRNNQSVSELIRTYITWGLEQEYEHGKYGSTNSPVHSCATK
jgi:macrodomain Ter protein organizer (MatP/YcbG family)